MPFLKNQKNNQTEKRGNGRRGVGKSLILDRSLLESIMRFPDIFSGKKILEKKKGGGSLRVTNRTWTRTATGSENDQGSISHPSPSRARGGEDGDS